MRRRNSENTGRINSMGNKAQLLAAYFLVLSGVPKVVSFAPNHHVGQNGIHRGLHVPSSSIPKIESRNFGKFATSSNENETKEKKGSLPRRAWNIYSGYFARLWIDTSPVARRRIAEDKATAAIERVEHLVQGEEYFDITHDEEETETARVNLLSACQEMLSVMHKSNDTKHELSAKVSEPSIVVNETAVALTDSGKEKSEGAVEEKTKKKGSRSVLFGAVMGAAVACWVFSGNYIFTLLFTLMTILGQLEYYRMVINTGVYPARRISVVGACSMFLTALFAPNLHQICLPMFGLWAMIWFLTMRRQVTTIPEIATTFTGMFLFGYVPSFWVRTRLIGGGMEPTRLAPLVRPLLELLGTKASALPAFIPKSIHLPITTGSIFIFWTWLAIAFSDVGAYFVGRKYGRTKLGEVAPAAGATSPNKSVEGVFGGCAVSCALGILGAWVQKWPYWLVTGATHGIIVGLLGLIGDLTASMLKRDAGFKDFGDLIPEHGGIMDRVDSYVFTAPYSWLVCAYIIPALKAFART